MDSYTPFFTIGILIVRLYSKSYIVIDLKNILKFFISARKNFSKFFFERQPGAMGITPG